MFTDDNYESNSRITGKVANIRNISGNEMYGESISHEIGSNFEATSTLLQNPKSNFFLNASDKKQAEKSYSSNQEKELEDLQIQIRELQTQKVAIFKYLNQTGPTIQSKAPSQPWSSGLKTIEEGYSRQTQKKNRETRNVETSIQKTEKEIELLSSEILMVQNQLEKLKTFSHSLKSEQKTLKKEAQQTENSLKTALSHQEALNQQVKNIVACKKSYSSKPASRPINQADSLSQSRLVSPRMPLAFGVLGDKDCHPLPLEEDSPAYGVLKRELWEEWGKEPYLWKEIEVQGWEQKKAQERTKWIATAILAIQGKPSQIFNDGRVKVGMKLFPDKQKYPKLDKIDVILNVHNSSYSPLKVTSFMVSSSLNILSPSHPIHANTPVFILSPGQSHSFTFTLPFSLALSSLLPCSLEYSSKEGSLETFDKAHFSLPVAPFLPYAPASLRSDRMIHLWEQATRGWERVIGPEGLLSQEYFPGNTEEAFLSHLGSLLPAAKNQTSLPAFLLVGGALIRLHVDLELRAFFLEAKFNPDSAQEGLQQMVKVIFKYLYLLLGN